MEGGVVVKYYIGFFTCLYYIASHIKGISATLHRMNDRRAAKSVHEFQCGLLLITVCAQAMLSINDVISYGAEHQIIQFSPIKTCFQVLTRIKRLIYGYGSEALVSEECSPYQYFAQSRYRSVQKW
jgi:hypothetical protein